MTRNLSKRGYRSAISLCAAAAAMFAAASPAFAETAPGISEAAVVTPLSLIKRKDLNMGQIVAGTDADVVTLGVDGTRSSSGGYVTLIGTDHIVARFAGQGALSQNVIISISPSTDLIGPGPKMVMNNFKFGPDDTVPGTYLPVGAGGNIVLTDPSGVYGFVVGADLNVGANQIGGTYTGDFEVTADYL